MSHLLAPKAQAELFAGRIADLCEAVEREQRSFSHDELREFEACTRGLQAANSTNVKIRTPAEARRYLSTPLDELQGVRTLPGRGDFMPQREDADGYDVAIAAWLKTQAGVPIDDDLFSACASRGISPHSGAFDVPLQRCRPRPGREWLTRHNQHGYEQRALGTQLGTAGGFTIQEGFVARLERAMLEQSGMLAASDIMTTPGGEDMPWPTSDDTSNEGELLGENTAVAEQDIAFGAVVFHAYKLSSKLVRVSAELLEDSAIPLAGEVGAILGERIGRALNRFCTVGTGASQPMGIVTAATVGVTAASATAIAADELIDLVHSVDPSYRSGPRVGWMMHDATLAAIRKLKSGDGDYLFAPGLTPGVPDRLLGYPIVINQHMASTLAPDAKPILFGALNKYKIRLVGSVRMRRLTERYAELDQTGFVGFRRFDGNLLDAGTNPVKLLQMAAA